MIDSVKLNKIFQEIYQILDFNDKYLETNKELFPMIRFIHLRIINPRCFISFIGETSSGKSTLINMILRKNLLPTYARPTTGTVTEIVFSDSNSIEPKFYAINREGTEQEISYDIFKKLSEKPENNLLRLYVDFPSFDPSLKGLTLIDTPGYNGINIEHEKILKDFLPNSDIVVYVIGYRQGFGQYDLDIFQLLKDEFEDLSKLPLLVVINRTPPDVNLHDKRVNEIIVNIKKLYEINFPIYLIPSLEINSFSNEHDFFSNIKDLFNKINEIAFSDERLNYVIEKHLNMTENIIEFLENEYDLILESLKLDEKKNQELEKSLNNFKLNEHKALELVDKTFTRLSNMIPSILDKRVEDSIKNIKKELENFNKWTEKQEATAYIFSHKLKLEIDQISKEVEFFIYNELQKLDEEIEDLVNTAVMELEKNIYNNLKEREILEKIIKKIYNKMGIKILKSLLSLKGGVGGYAAGLGNLAKMLTKKIGNIFGKTFPRSTYSKIGRIFNKTRANFIIQLSIEALLYIVDSVRFKSNVMRQIEESFNKWKKDSLEDIKNALRQNEIDTRSKINLFFSENIKEIYDEYSIIKEKFSIKPEEVKKIREQIHKIKLEIKEVMK